MHSDNHGARHVVIRGRGAMMYPNMGSNSTDARPAKIPMNDHPIDDLTLDPIVRHVGTAVGFGESKVGVANYRRKGASPCSAVIV